MQKDKVTGKKVFIVDAEFGLRWQQIRCITLPRAQECGATYGRLDSRIVYSHVEQRQCGEEAGGRTSCSGSNCPVCPDQEPEARGLSATLETFGNVILLRSNHEIAFGPRRASPTRWLFPYNW